MTTKDIQNVKELYNVITNSHMGVKNKLKKVLALLDDDESNIILAFCVLATYYPLIKSFSTRVYMTEPLSAYAREELGIAFGDSFTLLTAGKTKEFKSYIKTLPKEVAKLLSYMSTGRFTRNLGGLSVVLEEIVTNKDLTFLSTIGLFTTTEYDKVDVSTFKDTPFEEFKLTYPCTVMIPPVKIKTSNLVYYTREGTQVYSNLPTGLLRRRLDAYPQNRFGVILHITRTKRNTRRLIIIPLAVSSSGDAIKRLYKNGKTTTDIDFSTKALEAFKHTFDHPQYDILLPKTRHVTSVRGLQTFSSRSNSGIVFTSTQTAIYKPTKQRFKKEIKEFLMNEMYEVIGYILEDGTEIVTPVPKDIILEGTTNKQIEYIEYYVFGFLVDTKYITTHYYRANCELCGQYMNRKHKVCIRCIYDMYVLAINEIEDKVIKPNIKGWKDIMSFQVEKYDFKIFGTSIIMTKNLTYGNIKKGYQFTLPYLELDNPGLKHKGKLNNWGTITHNRYDDEISEHHKKLREHQLNAH